MGAIGPLFDPTSKHAVQGFGIEPPLTQLVLEGLARIMDGTSGMKPNMYTRGFGSGAKWHNTDIVL